MESQREHNFLDQFIEIPLTAQGIAGMSHFPPKEGLGNAGTMVEENGGSVLWLSMELEDTLTLFLNLWDFIQAYVFRWTYTLSTELITSFQLALDQSSLYRINLPRYELTPNLCYM